MTETRGECDEPILLSCRDHQALRISKKIFKNVNNDQNTTGGSQFGFTYGRLVGLNLSQQISFAQLLSHLLLPALHCSHGHGGRQGGEGDLPHTWTRVSRSKFDGEDGGTIFTSSATFMWEGYELPGAAGGAEAGGGGGGGGAEAVGEELTPAALMESNVTSLKAGMSSGLQA